MPVLDNATLQTLSDMAVGLAFDKTCQIQAEVLTPNTSGGSAPTYSTINTVLCCVVAEALQPTEKPIAGSLATETKKKVFFPRGTALQDSYRLLIDGRKYHITGLSVGASFEVLPSATVREEFTA